MPLENAELTFGHNVLDTFIDQFELSVQSLEMGRELICNILKLGRTPDTFHPAADYSSAAAAFGSRQIRGMGQRP